MEERPTHVNASQFVRPVISGKIIKAPAVRKDRIVTATAVDATVADFEAKERGVYEADAAQLRFVQQSRNEVKLDDVQLRAVDMCMTEQFAIIGGYAGTGKTTLMQQVVAALAQSTSVSQIEWKSFRTAGNERGNDMRPAVAMCCTTTMAARNLATKLPEDWAEHCMSIHALLAFAPVASGEFSTETGREIMRFEPRYHKFNKLPIDVLFFDEAGQIPLELWAMIMDAVQPHCRIYFLGDLAQLPPIFGPSPMTFALNKWPSVILDKIYRQKEGGVLLENITRIRRGLHPVHDNNLFRCGDKERLPDSPSAAAPRIAGYVGFLFTNKVFDPMQDIILTPENDADLGQKNWNLSFQIHFNPERRDPTGRVLNPYVHIRTALGTARFRVGDKVLATDSGGRRATERRFVNGSIGVIVKIEPNANYKGDISDTFMPDEGDMFQLDETDLGNDESLGLGDDEDIRRQMDELAAKTDDDSVRRRAASHIVHVRELATGEDFALSTSAEIQSLQFGYATTANRFQGSQARNVVVIVHHSMRHGLNREWLYTACSRAKERVFLLYTPRGLNASLERQILPGANPMEKAAALIQKFSNRNMRPPMLPKPRKL